MPLVDLHAHTLYSDGTSTPSGVVCDYLRAAVAIMAVTDHDTTQALQEARGKAASAGLPFINGVEISASEHDHLHILGYNIDERDERLQKLLADNRQNRNERIKKIIARLAQSGMDITQADVFGRVGNSASRAHVADAIKDKGITPTRQEAFRKYLIAGKVGYVAPQGALAAEVISTIKQAGGSAFIAHPCLIKEYWDFPKWTAAGLDGIEIYYPSHSLQLRKELLSIAKKYGLSASAGSDYHGSGSGRDNKIGLEVPDEVYKNLQKLCSRDCG
jgi:predicted metal-dependent phosphoesterase TrpH